MSYSPTQQNIKKNIDGTNIDISNAVRTNLSSFTLGEDWELDASGEAPYYTHLQRNDNLTSLMSGIRDPEVSGNETEKGLIAPYARVYNTTPNILSLEPNGPASSPLTFVPSIGTVTAPVNLSVTSVEFIIGENVLPTDRLVYTLRYDDANGKAFYKSELTGLTLNQGDPYEWNLGHPTETEANQIVYVEILKVQQNGAQSILQVGESQTPGEFYANLSFRIYRNADVLIDNPLPLPNPLTLSYTVDHRMNALYYADTTGGQITINIPFGVTAPFCVRDAKANFNTNNVVVNILDALGAVVHTAILNTRNRSFLFFFKYDDLSPIPLTTGNWYYSRTDRGEVVAVASTHTASDDFNDDLEDRIEALETRVTALENP